MLVCCLFVAGVAGRIALDGWGSAGHAAPLEASVSAAAGDASVDETPQPSHQGHELFPVPTFGGKQFWGDEYFYREYRIQHHVLTSQFRLLDDQDRRHAAGSFDDCRRALQRIVGPEKMTPMRGTAVLVLHGLGRSRACMEPLCDRLRRETGWWVFNIGYPSTRCEIAAHAQVLAQILESLPEIEEIHIVAHSMGNIVVRHYLGDCGAAGSTRRVDPRIRRMVMLGPPNHGSLLATLLAENELFAVLLGTPGQQLGRQWAQLEPRLAVPRFEFAVIAGGLGDSQGFNALLPGDDDGIVAVDSTRLSGSRDFLVLPVYHTFLVDDARVMQYTLNFLLKGQFSTPGQRRPSAVSATGVSVSSIKADAARCNAAGGGP